MCIMEVRDGQRNSTIAQACAHNLFTVVGDLAMFKTLLEARRAQDGNAITDSRVAEVTQLEAQLHATYETGLHLYGHFAADEALHGHAHGVDPQVFALEYNGAERAAEEIARQDEERARKYETR